jgi:hypothetical protein
MDVPTDPATLSNFSLSGGNAALGEFLFQTAIGHPFN